MHWMLNLIESALLVHPSEDWERVKALQKQAMQELEKEPVPEYLQYIAVPATPSVHAP